LPPFCDLDCNSGRSVEEAEGVRQNNEQSFEVMKMSTGSEEVQQNEKRKFP